MIDTRNFSSPTGGPAYPTNQYANGISPSGHSQGMTLRDYFAAKAMQAIMGSDKYTGVIGVNNYTHNASQDAYTMADAMLEARK